MISIPYGVSDFSAIRRDGLAFVDQTGALAELEASARHVLFLRPRRFGKSLWLSILEHYYDVRFADRFEELFGGLAIGRQPTPLRGSFLVLRLDFSAVDTSGDDERLFQTLADSVRSQIRHFLTAHARWLPDAPAIAAGLEALLHPVALLRRGLSAAQEAGLPVYVLIDEYDNFTNELVAARSEERYKSLVTGTGLLRTFFKALKEATSSTVQRTFTTGINPLLLSDLSSGFNIAARLGAELEFANLLGFGLEDVRGLLLQTTEHLTAEQRTALGAPEGLLELMVQWYDGYRFHPEGEARFNPDMVLYLLRSVVKGRLPDELVDCNLRTDVGKLDLIVRKAGDFDRLWRRIEREEATPGRALDTFGIDDLTNPAHFDSLLYYLGLLSYGEGPEPVLRVPNYVVRTLYWEELRKLLQRNLAVAHFEPVRAALGALMRSGQAGRPFFQLIVDQVLALAVSRDLIQLSEAAIKTACLALLSLSDELLVFSEWATHRGYADLVLVPAPTSSWLSLAWMIELKYLKKGDDSPAARRRALDEGRAQLERYCQDETRMAYLGKFTLYRAVALFVGVDELVWDEG